jgi:hypothetical protein
MHAIHVVTEYTNKNKISSDLQIDLQNKTNELRKKMLLSFNNIFQSTRFAENKQKLLLSDPSIQQLQEKALALFAVSYLSPHFIPPNQKPHPQ